MVFMEDLRRGLLSKSNNLVISIGNPPAMPGDSQSLTFTGFYLSSAAVNASKYIAIKHKNKIFR